MLWLYYFIRKYEFILLHLIHNSLVSFFESLREEEGQSTAFLSFSFPFCRFPLVRRRGLKTYIRYIAVWNNLQWNTILKSKMKKSYLNIDDVACKVTYATVGMNTANPTISPRGTCFILSNLSNSICTKSSMSLETMFTIFLTVFVYINIWPK